MRGRRSGCGVGHLGHHLATQAVSDQDHRAILGGCFHDPPHVMDVVIQAHTGDRTRRGEVLVEILTKNATRKGGVESVARQLQRQCSPARNTSSHTSGFHRNDVAQRLSLAPGVACALGPLECRTLKRPPPRQHGGVGRSWSAARSQIDVFTP
jgi:hypothetical protein